VVLPYSIGRQPAIVRVGGVSGLAKASEAELGKQYGDHRASRRTILRGCGTTVRGKRRLWRTGDIAVADDCFSQDGRGCPCECSGDHDGRSDVDVKRADTKATGERIRMATPEPAASLGGDLTWSVLTGGRGQAITQITSKDFEAEVLQSDIPVFVCFTTSHCRSCFAFCLVVEDLTSEYQGRAKFVMIDAEKEPQVAESHGVCPLPIVLLFRNGKVRKKLVGFHRKGLLRRQLSVVLEEEDQSPSALTGGEA
jgi:thioredoxin 1